MKTAITIDIDTDKLSHYTDAYLAQLWHVAQANPAPITDRDAAELVEQLGAEITRRWLTAQAPELYSHQATHHYSMTLAAHGRWIDNGRTWVPGKEQA